MENYKCIKKNKKMTEVGYEHKIDIFLFLSHRPLMNIYLTIFMFSTFIFFVDIWFDRNVKYVENK